MDWDLEGPPPQLSLAGDNQVAMNLQQAKAMIVDSMYKGVSLNQERVNLLNSAQSLGDFINIMGEQPTNKSVFRYLSHRPARVFGKSRRGKSRRGKSKQAKKSRRGKSKQAKKSRRSRSRKW
jgi:hypothetical protein